MEQLNLMPHQQKALDLTEKYNRCAYYLDMGLGKTFVGAEKMYLLNNDVNLLTGVMLAASISVCIFGAMYVSEHMER